jgi:HEAT repeat protein
MSLQTLIARPQLRRPQSAARLLLACVALADLHAAAYAQAAPAITPPAATAPPSSATDETDAPAATLSTTSTPEDRDREAWRILTDAAGDAKRPQTRIQALAALGMLNSPRSAKLIVNAMGDPDLDVRTAAALAAGQTKDRDLTTNLRDLLDDKEPQVAFTAAMTLWKMGDKSGEDILMAVVDGERKAGANLINGTEHNISKELHDPAAMAKLGALQGASMLLGPFGYGITAYEYIHKSGGDLSRVAAIEQISQEKTDPIHKELIAALRDKDPSVRAAAAKALVDYRDKSTSMAIYPLFVDPKYPVRLTSAAAYLRTIGIPGPAAAASAHPAKSAN